MIMSERMPPRDEILVEQIDNHSETALSSESNAQQPQQLDYNLLISLGKRDREEGQDAQSEEKSQSAPSESSVGGDNGKRQKTSEEAASEQKLNNENWNVMYQRLIAFKEQHEHCLVPKRYSEDPKLGTWVETQRVQYKRLERDVCGESGVESIKPNKRLCSERLQKLQDIGFAWSAKNVKKAAAKSPTLTTPAPPQPVKKTEGVGSAKTSARNRWNDAMWEEYFNKLKAYKEKHGDCLVPRKYEEDPKLSTFVETQRALWNRDFKQQETEAKAKSAEGADSPSASVPIIAAAVPTVLGMAEAGAEAKPGAVPEGVLMDPVSGILPAKRLTQERKDRLDELGFIWSLRHKRIADHWQNMFNQLAEYKAVHGDCLVPSRYESNMKLGKWVETQRYEYTKLQRAAEGGKGSMGEPKSDMEELLEDVPPGAEDPNAMGTAASATAPISNPRLTQERIDSLNAIGFEWKVKNKMKRYYDKQWEGMLSRLLAYKAKYGHCNVPKRYKEDPKLGTWVHTQRIQYRKFVAGTAKKGGDTAEFVASGDIKSEEEVTFRLTEDRKRRLEEVGFAWSSKECEKGTAGAAKIVRNSYDAQWDGMFGKLLGFKERHGHCLVPKRYQEDPKLGCWVDTQRVQYKKMKKKLAEQGISYEGPSPDEVQEESNVAAKPVVGRLTDDRIRRLESIGFTWSLRDDWQKHYDELKEFRHENGHCNVPARYAKNRRLGIWVSAQRQQYKLLKAAQDPTKPKRTSPLTQERIKLLDDLGFTWTVRSRDTSSEAWNIRFDALTQYKEHGDCRVPMFYPPIPELGVFVEQQRNQYKLYMEAKLAGADPSFVSEMTEERINRLEKLGVELGGVVGSDEGKENEEDNLLAAGAMMANFRQQQALVNPGDFGGNAENDSVLQEALQRSELI